MKETSCEANVLFPDNDTWWPGWNCKTISEVLEICWAYSPFVYWESIKQGSPTSSPGQGLSLNDMMWNISLILAELWWTKEGTSRPRLGVWPYMLTRDTQRSEQMSIMIAKSSCNLYYQVTWNLMWNIISPYTGGTAPWSFIAWVLWHCLDIWCFMS